MLSNAISEAAVKRGNFKAFPVPKDFEAGGMTIREYLAAAAIAGLAWQVDLGGKSAAVLAACAVELADEVLVALELSPP